jgi:hypothetical protein
MGNPYYVLKIKKSRHKVFGCVVFIVMILDRSVVQVKHPVTGLWTLEVSKIILVPLNLVA